MGGDLWNLDALAALRSSPFPVIISGTRLNPPYCITKMWMNRRLRESCGRASGILSLADALFHKFISQGSAKQGSRHQQSGT